MARQKTKKKKIKKQLTKKPIIKKAKTAKKVTVKSKPKTKTRKKPAAKKALPKKRPVRPKTKSPKKKASPKRAITKKVSSKKTRKAESKIMMPTDHLLQARRLVKQQDEKKGNLRSMLISKREEILKEVRSEISSYIKGETKQLVETALDDGDLSIVDLSEDIRFKHLGSHRDDLLKIDESLRKLDEGTYGICEDCGDEISEARLKVLPFAIYCIDCQEKRELLEEMERKERMIR
jgi:DnaK suppressor protein